MSQNCAHIRTGFRLLLRTPVSYGVRRRLLRKSSEYGNRTASHQNQTPICGIVSSYVSPLRRRRRPCRRIRGYLTLGRFSEVLPCNAWTIRSAYPMHTTRCVSRSRFLRSHVCALSSRFSWIWSLSGFLSGKSRQFSVAFQLFSLTRLFSLRDVTWRRDELQFKIKLE